MQRTSNILVVLTAALAVAGCSGNPPQLSGAEGTAGATGLSTATAGTASAFASPSAKPAEGASNPFGDPTSSTTGARQIIANPTRADIFAPSPLPEMALGRADAPVTIVQYASLTCPHCRAFHRDVFPALKRELIDTGKVRYVMREFPIGRQSGNATIALRCAPADKYFALYGKFMEQQDAWVSQEVRLEPIFKVAAQVGLKQAEFDACLKNEKLIADLNAIKERGRTLGIIGTPNFFIGTTLVKKRLSIEDVRTMVAEAQAGAPVAAARP